MIQSIHAAPLSFFFYFDLFMIAVLHETVGFM